MQEIKIIENSDERPNQPVVLTGKQIELMIDRIVPKPIVSKKSGPKKWEGKIHPDKLRALKKKRKIR